MAGEEGEIKIKLTGRWLGACPSHIQKAPIDTVIDPFDLNADFRVVFFGKDFQRDLRPVSSDTEEQLHVEVRQQEQGNFHQFTICAVHPELAEVELGKFLLSKTDLALAVNDPIRLAVMRVLLHRVER